MIEQSLTIPFALPTGDDVMNPYWLRFEIVEDKSTMTVGQAAKVIDALYNVSICDQDYPDKEPEVKPVPDANAWARAFNTIYSMPGCEGREAVENDDPGSYDVMVRVYRSHRYELYKMVLTNGSIGSIKHIEKRVELTLDIENQTHITLDQPIIKYPSFGWQDIDGPTIKRMGNTLYWDEPVTGVLRAEFNTEFDLVDIHVYGINHTGSSVVTGTDHTTFGTGWYSGDEDGSELTDVQDTECTLLGFYHYQYEEMQLHKPENDESVDPGMADSICSEFGNTDVNNGDGDGDGDQDKRCYQTARVTEICICGGDSKTVVKDIPVNCPDGVALGSKIGEDGISTEYVDCGSDDATVHNGEFYLENCCKVPPEGIVLPKCEEHHAPFGGGVEANEEDLKAAYGEDAIIVSVGSRQGGCGETITTQDVDSKDCCEDIPAIADNGSDSSIQEGGQVRFKGGLPPYHVTDDTGADYWLEAAQCTFNSETGLWEGSFSVSVETDPCAGNSVGYSVEDKCSTFGGTMGIDNTYVALDQEGRIIATPETDVSISFTGGVGPFEWGESQFLKFDVTTTAGRTNVAHVQADFCGQNSVYVTDSCGKGIDIVVLSIDGEWEHIPATEDDWWNCQGGAAGLGCFDPEGETTTWGAGECYETEVPADTGYRGAYKGVYEIDICGYNNSHCDYDEWCANSPTRCPSVGGALSFECGEFRGRRDCGICGRAEAVEAYYTAVYSCLGSYCNSVDTPCDGVVSCMHDFTGSGGSEVVQRCNVVNIAQYGAIYEWKCGS